MDKNVWLSESLLDILYDHSSQKNNPSVIGYSNASSPMSTDQQSTSSQSIWIYGYSELMRQSVYTYLSLISDHAHSPSLSKLRQRETDFCCQVLRDKWNECMIIGRDLVRLLQNLSNNEIVEFMILWNDILQAPHILSTQFAKLGGLIYLMKLPSCRKCLRSRITNDLEIKIYFLITRVKNGNQKR